MAKKRAASEERDVIVWMRLPKELSLEKIKKLGLDEVACYGGDTCIAATSPSKGAALHVKGPKSQNLKQLLKKSGLNPRSECYGGDTCIV